jgi:tetratricopeptide (TPR) repeat protein
MTLVLLLTASVGAAQQPTVHRHPGLGSLEFPTSGPARAQADFERGVLLMHSFEYEDAATAFRAAQEMDAGFAMAYWGEAMTHNHPVWNIQDRDAALKVLERYAPTAADRAARAPTARERMYIEAVDLLYGAGDKAARDTLYSRSMEALATAYPDDREARAFHALSILGLSGGDRDIPSYMRAGAIALDLFEENPDHPGAAHYVIHAFDDPAHAPLGLEAAVAYSDIAPDAPHAQHMTTHIFLALGMWDRVVESNERASAVFDHSRHAEGLKPTMCGHYRQWLAYGYDQHGRHADAEVLILGCIEEARAEPRLAVGAEGMRALHVASTENLDGPVARAALDAQSVSAAARPTMLVLQDWTGGYIAGRRGDPVEAARRLEALEKRLAAEPALPPFLADYAPVLRGTLRSVVAAARGDLERAIEEARRAAALEAALPVDFGPPLSFKPPRELEGELLLAVGRTAEALAAFTRALERTPRRATSIEGYQRAGGAPERDRERERLR